MRFQNDTTGGSRSDREIFATTKAWTLSAGTGLKTVYVEFDTNNTTGTAEISSNDTIIYVLPSMCSDISQAECDSLVALYNNTNGANWTNDTNWLQT
ncbi:TPA: hypothetical protein DCZ39_06955 [Patescibacteria group bacterium]|nr:hypothetical protein [Candidatus Gracilibacteria bacterium]